MNSSLKILQISLSRKRYSYSTYAIFEIKTTNFQHWLMGKVHMYPIEIVNLQDCCKTVWVEIVELLWSVSCKGFY